MVAPKTASNHTKGKNDEKKSAPSSPEPFQEPDGMTTIDLNKSDDYSKENDEAEKAKLEQRAQIRYTTHLLFALCSIFFVVLVMITVAFLNKEYHLFKVLPLKLNHSHPNPTTSSPTEEFVNLTKILNQAMFRDKLKSGGYLENAYGQMDLCRLKQTLENCCEIFKDTDLEDLAEYCTVNEMLNLLLEIEHNRRQKRQIYNEYPNLHRHDQYPSDYHDQFVQAPPIPDSLDHQFIPQQYFERPDPNNFGMAPEEAIITHFEQPSIPNPVDHQFIPQYHFEAPGPNDFGMVPHEAAINTPNFLLDHNIPRFEQQPLIENPQRESLNVEQPSPERTRQQIFQQVTEDFHHENSWPRIQQDLSQFAEPDEFERSGGTESKLQNLQVNANGNFRFPEEQQQNNQEFAKKLQNHEVVQQFSPPVFRPDLGLIEESLAGFHPRDSEPKEQQQNNQEITKSLQNHGVRQQFPPPVFRPHLGLIEESLAGFHPRESEPKEQQQNNKDNTKSLQNHEVSPQFPPPVLRPDLGLIEESLAGFHPRNSKPKEQQQNNQEITKSLQNHEVSQQFPPLVFRPDLGLIEESLAGFHPRGSEPKEQQQNNRENTKSLQNHEVSQQFSPPVFRPDLGLIEESLAGFHPRESEPKQQQQSNQEITKSLQNHEVSQQFPPPVFRPDLGLIEESLAGFHPRESEPKEQQQNNQENTKSLQNHEVGQQFPPPVFRPDLGLIEESLAGFHPRESEPKEQQQNNQENTKSLQNHGVSQQFPPPVFRPDLGLIEESLAGFHPRESEPKKQQQNNQENTKSLQNHEVGQQFPPPVFRPDLGLIEESLAGFHPRASEPKEQQQNNKENTKSLQNHEVSQQFPLPVFRPDLGLIEESLTGFHPRESEPKKQQQNNQDNTKSLQNHEVGQQFPPPVFRPDLGLIEESLAGFHPRESEPKQQQQNNQENTKSLQNHEVGQQFPPPVFRPDLGLIEESLAGFHPRESEPKQQQQNNQENTKSLQNHEVGQQFPPPVFRPDLGLIEESLAGFHPRESELNRNQHVSSNFDENTRVIPEWQPENVSPTKANQNGAFLANFQSTENNAHQAEQIKPVDDKETNIKCTQAKAEVDVSKNTESPIQSSADIFSQTSTNPPVHNTEQEFSNVLENTRKQIENSSVREAQLSKSESNSTMIKTSTENPLGLNIPSNLKLNNNSVVPPGLRSSNSGVDDENSWKQKTTAQSEDARVDEAPLKSKNGSESGLEDENIESRKLVDKAARAFEINDRGENISSNSDIQHSRTFNVSGEDIHEETSTAYGPPLDKENFEVEIPSNITQKNNHTEVDSSPTTQNSTNLKPSEDKIQQSSNSQTKQTGRSEEVQDFNAPNLEMVENKGDLQTITSIDVTEADSSTNSAPEDFNLGSKFTNEDAITNNDISITTTVMPESISLDSNNEAKVPSTPQDSLLQFQQPTIFQINEDDIRANADQNDFRGKTKQLDSFTATEDVQSNQQAMFNPCFYPYMNPYMQFMPPPPKVNSAPDPGYLKIISVSQPKIQNQPMYVLNPSMYYGIPPSAQPTYPSSPYLPPTYYPPPMTQAPQNPLGVSHSAAIQVAAPGGQYYMCNPIPTPTNNIAGLAGVEVRRDASNLQTLMEGIEQFEISNKSREATLICPLGEQACADDSLCIKNHHICDSEVHCDDSSDEIACSCKERVGKLRLCDGYCDCPRCDDEQGCFGCEPNEFSCDDWSRFRRSTCIPIVQKCDGIKQCEVTGKDEMDCSILADHIGNFPLNKISNSVGFLHRNYRGKWYPTCFGTELWAAQVCQVEAGPSAIIPKAHMTLTTDPYNGLFINILPNNEISLVNTCVQDRAAFVECPPIYCGLRFLVNNPYRDQEVDTSIEDMLNDLERAYKMREKRNIEDRVKGNFTHEHLEEVIENLERTFRRRDLSSDDSLRFILKESRVVGGTPSQPAAWPWLVSIYKNGIFHCGGVLINELWVVTASHCVDRYYQYYYEIQAGALRRYSYAPMDQRRWAKVVVPHEFYSKSNLRNDIALMKLSGPVRYNRHVRPICLPSESTAGQEFLKGPSAGTICTTVGWGATVEHGADPDHMREVEVPILQHCRHREDSDIEEICAGLHEGGKDACQGDSGGPLMCRNPNNPNQWYLAGIVSHGEGCARPNEPGVYTKVSRYIGWIAENTREDKLTLTTPLQRCPGYICRGTKRCIAKKRRCDRIVDCLLGDDELDCENQFKQVFKHSNLRKSMMPTLNTVKPSDDFMAYLVQSLEPVEEFGLLGSILNSTKEAVSSNATVEDLKDDLGTKASEKKGFEDVYFKCQILLQVIPIEKRCNKIRDCEDGTDELNCSCADYIRAIDASAICDGVTDCGDLSDENDCVKCNKTEYTCRLSQKCIDITKRCDGTGDCPQNEDELNCVSLTNGHTITLDKDNRPMFKSRGIVTVNHQGTWKPLCLNDSSLFVDNEPSLSTVICNLLGFDEYLTYHKYRMVDRVINSSYSMSSGRITLDPEPNKCDNCCNGLYIRCSNTSTSSTLHYKSLEQVKELYFSPWMAAIYANGEYKCMGTLLDEFWIVTSAKCFKGIQSLQRNYVVAVLGKGKLHLTVKGPHEQVIRVSGSVTINETDIVLLRLVNDVKFNRYVQAADLNARRDGLQREKCYATGKNNENMTMFVPLMPLKNCLVGYRCFEKKIEENCKDNHPWSGTIICDSRLGWYPAAVFNEEEGHCGLSHNKKYTSVKFSKNQIFKIMTLTPKPTEAPLCLGLQCNLGNCIPEAKICDGVSDCHDGEDEMATLCYEKEKDCHLRDNCVCPPTHLKCPNTNKCHPKSTFCDRTNDCGEFQDEPDVCSCRNYLKLTDPGKLCDGTLNCMDRTDEDPEMCDCKLDDFQCGKLNKCVPQEMVCDGVRDCPNGEDEAACLSLKTEDNERINAGEVMTKTAGIWHRGCFDLTYSGTKLAEICTQLGLKGSNASQLTPPQNLTTLSTLRPVLDKFEVVWLRRQPGNKMRLRLRSGHDPYVKFVKDKKCHRLFVACI